MRRPLPRLVRSALLCLAAATATSVVSVFILGEQLMWEGADQVFLKHFPFWAIWSLCGLGAALATAALVRRGRARGAAVAALVLNVLVAGFFVYSYASTLSGVRERYPNWSP